MKKIIYIFLLGIIMSSCADENLGPILTFDKAGKGVYPKLVSQTPQLLDLANLGTAAYDYCVEFVDETDGSSAKLYEVEASFVDNNPDNGDKSADAIVIKSFTSDQFTTSANGNREVCVSITLSELLAAFGMTPEDLVANDNFAIRTFVSNVDGVRFGFANSDSDVSGSAFGGHFNMNLTATCPMADNLFVGDYELTYELLDGNGFGESLRETTVTLSASSPTKRTFPAILLDAFGGFNVTVELEFVCDFVRVVPLDAGISCAAPNIMFVNRSAGVNYTEPADITNDAVIRVSYVEAGGGCAYDAVRTMILTKK